jgi:SAM-dependent methyltransferase
VLRGRGEQLPLRDGSADVCFSSNLLEHVAAPFAVADEIVRVTRPGGLVVLGYTNWLSPWGGHETSPWHYSGGERAARRYARRHGHPPKNRFGSTLFPLSVAAVLDWARAQPDLQVIDARPRYLPPWARSVTRVPGCP